MDKIIQAFMQKWSTFVGALNSRGIPLPMARDPATGVGSITVSLIVVSAGLCGICVLAAIGTIINNLAGLYTVEVDINALKEAHFMSFQMLLASMALYAGRKIQTNGSGKVEIGNKENEESK